MLPEPTIAKVKNLRPCHGPNSTWITDNSEVKQTTGEVVAGCGVSFQLGGNTCGMCRSRSAIRQAPISVSVASSC